MFTDCWKSEEGNSLQLLCNMLNLPGCLAVNTVHNQVHRGATKTHPCLTSCVVN